MGLPVIVSRLASVQELVTDGQDGLFVEPGSVDSLVEAIVRLCSDDALFRRLRTGTPRTGELYGSDRAAAMLDDICGRAAACTDAAAQRGQRARSLDGWRPIFKLR